MLGPMIVRMNRLYVVERILPPISNRSLVGNLIVPAVLGLWPVAVLLDVKLLECVVFSTADVEDFSAFHSRALAWQVAGILHVLFWLKRRLEVVRAWTHGAIAAPTVRDPEDVLVGREHPLGGLARI